MKKQLITLLFTISLLSVPLTSKAGIIDSFFESATEVSIAMLDLMSKLSDDIGIMADRILTMADKIGEMADRIVDTEELMSETLLGIQDNMNDLVGAAGDSDSASAGTALLTTPYGIGVSNLPI